MEILFIVADIIVLALLVIRVLRAFWSELPQGAGSVILVVLIAVPLLAFATVSFTVYVGLVTNYPSLFSRAVALVFLVGMLALLRVTWAQRPSGAS